MNRIDKQEKNAKKDKVEMLKKLWVERVKKILDKKPLDGIYCVYSMYWRNKGEEK